MKPSLVAKTAAALGAFSFALLVGACSNEQTGPTNPYAAQIAALGFRTDMIEDMGDYLLVEGDIRIDKSRLQRPDALRPSFQWTTDTLVGSSQVQNIVVDLSGLSSQPAWQAAARSAITEWNKVNCSSVQLMEGSPADITFSTFADPGRPGLAAVGSFPDDAPDGSGKPGPTIDVNTAYTLTPNNSSTKLRTMVHEIGHTVAFRHTNWQGLGEPVGPYGANQVPGTPATDAASVMNGGNPTASWDGFSSYDTVAARVRYPGGPCVTITGSDYIYYQQSTTCTYYASASGGVAPIVYTWSFQYPIQGFSPENGKFIATASGSDYPRQGSLTVTATDAAGLQGSVTKVITIQPYSPPCT